MAENQINEDLISHLVTVGSLYSKVPDTWRSSAFFKVVATIRSYKKEVVLENGKLARKIPGVGPSIQKTIEQFLNTGTSEKYETLKETVKDKEPKRHDADKVRKILDGYLSVLDDFKVDWGYAGSMRRGLPAVKDVDVIICIEDDNEKEQLRPLFEMQGLTFDIRNGDKKWGMTVPLWDDETITLDLNFCKPEYRGAYYNYFTGSKEFNVTLRSLAKAKGFKINEYGIYKGKERLGGEKETDQFDVLGIPYLEPKDRTPRNIPSL